MLQTIRQKLNNQQALYAVIAGTIGLVVIMYYISTRFNTVIELVNLRTTPVITVQPPDVSVPNAEQLIDIINSRDSGYSRTDIVTKGLDEKLKETRYTREVGKIENIKFNTSGNSYIIVTDMGYVVGSVPTNVPIRVGEEINIRQDYSEESERYYTWICPKSSKLCHVLNK